MFYYCTIDNNYCTINMSFVNISNFKFRALCDTNQSGKLTLEQFALAMWMVERKQKGIDPPQVLTANMVPPSMRAIVSGVDIQAQVCNYIFHMTSL